MPEFFGRKGKQFNIPPNYNQSTVLHATDGINSVANGKWTNSGFLLMKGSLARKSHTLKSNPGVIDTKNKLIQRLLLITSKQDPAYYILQEDILLSSPSTAARLVHGNDRNGWTDWKNAIGDQLRSLLR